VGSNKIKRSRMFTANSSGVLFHAPEFIALDRSCWEARELSFNAPTKSTLHPARGQGEHSAMNSTQLTMPSGARIETDVGGTFASPAKESILYTQVFCQLL